MRIRFEEALLRAVCRALNGPAEPLIAVLTKSELSDEALPLFAAHPALSVELVKDIS